MQMMAATDELGMHMVERDGWRRLLATFDLEPARAAERYRRARLRVIERLRARRCPDAEAIADEAFERAARRLGGGEVVRGEIEHYVNGIARLVALEAGRKAQRLRSLDRDPPDHRSYLDEDPAIDPVLERCLDDLGPDGRALLIAYHTGDGAERIAARRRLADQLGIGLNALRIRAHRLRGQLELGVRRALADA
jgi:DNA-directed RNA polymerase specialized sigma24 family protein